MKQLHILTDGDPANTSLWVCADPDGNPEQWVQLTSVTKVDIRIRPDGVTTATVTSAIGGVNFDGARPILDETYEVTEILSPDTLLQHVVSKN